MFDLKDEGNEVNVISVYDAYKIMNRNCDGARKGDGLGFSSYDRKKIDNLLEYDKSAVNEKGFMNVLESYSNTQLKNFDIRFEYNRTPELDDFDIVLDIKTKIDNEDNIKREDILIRFDYDEELVDLMSNSTAEFNSDTKNWHLDISQYDNITAYLEKQDYEYLDKTGLDDN